ncbi:hypothetical protein ABIB80_007956 [Bradyrhizobium sp. i1.15.2]
MAQRTLVPVPDPALAHARLSGPAQFGFLTDDYELALSRSAGQALVLCVDEKSQI